MSWTWFFIAAVYASGAFTSAAGTVANAQSIVVRVTAAAAPGGTAQATLTVGSVAATFAVSTSTDVTPPTATVVFPTAQSRTSSEQLIVRGTASDSGSPVGSVRVNGVEATSTDNFATWTATVPLAAGANSVVVDAMDRALNRSAATARAAVTRNALIGFIEGLAVDTAQNRVIAADTFAGVLLSIDLASGLRTVIANAATPPTSTAFDRLVSPSSVALEADGTHALVLDRSNAAILRVNLATGARTVVSGRGFPDSVNDFGNNATAMSVDFVNGRAYVLGRFPDAIYSVNLMTGVRTVLSDATRPNAVDMFPNPVAMALDPARGRLLVGDQGTPGPGTTHAIYTVDLAMGARAILSSNTVPNASNPLSFVGGFGIDGDRALVLQPFSSSVLAVDLVTVPGNRTVFSSPNVPHELEHARAIAVDAANGRALVADFGTRSLVAVRLTDGARTVVSPNEPADIGAPQRSSTGVALDLNANRIYVTDPADASRSLLAVNLATGDRTLVSSSTVSSGPPWVFPNAVAIDEPNNRFLVADLQGPAMYEVDFDTGERSVMSGVSQSGTPFVWPHTLAIDRENNRALVADGALNAVVAVSLTDGARTILSGPAVPPGPVELDMPYGIALDAAANRALVTHFGPPSVVAVDLATGARTVLATAGNTGTWLPQGIGIDAATRTIVTGDGVIGAVHVIDPVSGNRTLVSSSSIPRLNDRLRPRGVAVDGSRRIAWVTSDDFGILQIVDLVTGERVFLTR